MLKSVRDDFSAAVPTYDKRINVSLTFHTFWRFFMLGKQIPPIHQHTVCFSLLRLRWSHWVVCTWSVLSLKWMIYESIFLKFHSLIPTQNRFTWYEFYVYEINSFACSSNKYRKNWKRNSKQKTKNKYFLCRFGFLKTTIMRCHKECNERQTMCS